MLRFQNSIIAVVLAVVLSSIGCTHVSERADGDRGLVTWPGKIRNTDSGINSVGLDPRARDIERSLGVE